MKAWKAAQKKKATSQTPDDSGYASQATTPPQVAPSPPPARRQRKQRKPLAEISVPGVDTYVPHYRGVPKERDDPYAVFRDRRPDIRERDQRCNLSSRFERQDSPRTDKVERRRGEQTRNNGKAPQYVDRRIREENRPPHRESRDEYRDCRDRRDRQDDDRRRNEDGHFDLERRAEYRNCRPDDRYHDGTARSGSCQAA